MARKDTQRKRNHNVETLSFKEELKLLLDERSQVEHIIADANQKLFQIIVAIIVPLVAFLGYVLVNYTKEIRFVLLGVPFVIILSVLLVGALFTELFVAGKYVRHLSSLINPRLREEPLLLEKLRYDFIVRGFGLQTAFLLLSIVLFCAIDVLCLILAPRLLKEIVEKIIGQSPPPKGRVVMAQCAYLCSVVGLHLFTCMSFFIQYFCKAKKLKNTIATRDWQT